MKNYIPYIIAAVFLLLFLHQCQERGRQENVHDANLAAMADTVRHFTNELGGQTAEIKTLQLTQKQLAETVAKQDRLVAAMVKEFATVRSVTRFKGDIRFDSIAVAFDDPVDFMGPDSSGRFERTGSVFTDWYSLGYKVTNDSLEIEPFYTWTSAAVVTGTKRNWFLGKETVTTNIAFDNPFIEVTDLQAAEVVVPVPVYKKWYVWLGIGAAGGFLLSR